MKNDLREKGRQQQKRNDGAKGFSVTQANSRGHSINGEKGFKAADVTQGALIEKLSGCGTKDMEKKERNKKRGGEMLTTSLKAQDP